ncbi:putative major facilitator superfamily domain, MFS transporter superfamily [Helianthus annuus]|nr:putative MFS transporter superfamily [Helianthus annuus]KAJ0819778.1 putative major facilitator superfamily domain, MFS transporter superfamily [Helianthus annuus]
MANNKWLATVASIWIECSCGASSTFGIYSATLKSSQGYDQSTLDTVSVFKDIGSNIGVLSGLLYSAVTSSSRFGSGLWLVYLAGAVQFFTGYFFIWLSVTGVIDRPHVLLMCLFMFMAAHAQTFFSTPDIVVAIRNFPDYSGTSVGIMKGFFGLSGAILIQIYYTLFDNKPTTYLLMLAVFPTLVSLAFMSLVHINPSNTSNDKPHLNRFSLISLIIATYLMIVLIFQNIFTLPSWTHILTTTILLIMALSPLQVALTAQRSEQRPPSPVMAPLITTLEDQKEVEMNLLQAMSTINFWLLFLAMVCTSWSALATINNITQVGESLDYSTIEINTIVSLWSIWNFLGRFVGGFVSDLFIHRYGLGRPLFFSLTQLTMVVGYLIIALSGNLYIGSVIVGVCFGSQWSLMPIITLEIFGVKHTGTIFNSIGAAIPIGSYIFSVQVIGKIYDKEAQATGGLCHGLHCFMLSYFIFVRVSLFGVLSSFVLFLRTRGFYASILQNRLK